MKNFKLEIEMLPKGAWNNDFSKSLPKKEWDIVRKACYQRANHKCQICGLVTDDLDAHEVWEFDVKNKTQTLKDIIGICSKCHGVKHFKNSVRLGYGEEAEKHFLEINNCSDMEFANYLNKSLIEYEERNKILRWNIIANLEQFGGKGIEIKQNNIPLIKNPYEHIDWNILSFEDTNELFEIIRNDNLICTPKILSINVNNYQGFIQITSLFTDRIEWYLDGEKITTKYNVVGLFITEFRVKNIVGNHLKFKIIGSGGETISKPFELLPSEVI